MEMLKNAGVRIERIVWIGKSTPADKPYNQEKKIWGNDQAIWKRLNVMKKIKREDPTVARRRSRAQLYEKGKALRDPAREQVTRIGTPGGPRRPYRDLGSIQ